MRGKQWLVVGLMFSMTLVGALAQDVDETGVDGSIEDAVQAFFSAEELTPLVGSPVTLQLTVIMPEGGEVIEWLVLRDDVTLEVVQHGEVYARETDDGVMYQEDFEVSLWRTGDWRTPEVFVAYKLPDDDRVLRIPVRPVFFTVPSVLESDDLNVLVRQPSRAPISLPYTPLWLYGAAVLGFFGVMGGAAYALQRSRNRDVTPVEPSPFDVILDLLRSYARDIDTLEPDRFYDGVTQAVRGFVGAMFGIQVVHATTDELISVLREREVLDAELIEALRIVLNRVDVAKYAQIDREDAGTLMQLTYNWVRLVEKRVMAVTEVLEV